MGLSENSLGIQLVKLAAMTQQVVEKVLQAATMPVIIAKILKASRRGRKKAWQVRSGSVRKGSKVAIASTGKGGIE